MSVADTAGICILCHTSAVEDIDYYPGSNLWVGTNGHGNSTLGGDPTGVAVDLFDAERGGDSNFFMHAQGAPTGENSRWGDSGSRKNDLPSSRYFESIEIAKNTGGYAPPRNTGWFGDYDIATGVWGTGADIAPGDNDRSSQYDVWYAGTASAGYGNGIGVDGTTGRGSEPERAHNFSCSKCHTPHASGLPALLMTNCLDYQLPKNDAQGWVGVMEKRGGNNTPVDVGPNATDTWALNVMGNCHRNDSSATGWNRLAPDQ
jgi:hypothetical protein